MAGPSLRRNLDQIRSWVRQGRTDLWIAHQLGATVEQIETFKRDHDLGADAAGPSLRPHLNQIRSWVRQGRTDSWIAHQLEVTVQQIEAFKRDYDLVPVDPERGMSEADLDDERAPRAEDDGSVATDLEAADRQPTRTPYTLFVSYRREETSAAAGRLFDWLDRHFGPDQVFMDLDLEPGVDFANEIEEAVGACRVLLAVIGPRWTNVVDEQGEPRLRDPHDLLRLEIEAALRRPDVRVIPVLVQGAPMPKRRDLPETLAPLARRNAIVLSDAAWRRDVARLIDAVDRILGR